LSFLDAFDVFGTSNIEGHRNTLLGLFLKIQNYKEDSFDVPRCSAFQKHHPALRLPLNLKKEELYFHV
jgi:hypothetical protein